MHALELAADCFAAELLMPSRWVNRVAAAEDWTVPKLARHFMVSEWAMSRRVSELKLAVASRTCGGMLN